MKHFCTTDDITELADWLHLGNRLRAEPDLLAHLGRGKTLCLLFFNNSLRTRLSTQKAAQLLGMEVMVMNFGSEGWSLEYTDGTVMDQGTAEHIREAAPVVAQYADLIGIRAFAGLKDREADYAEMVLQGFVQHAGIPVLNMESATAHPLQALADALTIEQFREKDRPKVVLSWAPHPRALPQAVPNSFAKMMQALPVDLTITHPEGYELAPEFTGGLSPEYNQEKALEGADFVYVKNWSSYSDYGAILSQDPAWMMTAKKLGEAQLMHCLPVRRNVVVADDALDGGRSLVLQQAANRTLSAQLALAHLIQSNS
ncbi:Rossmann-fold NAD(P)-binding domain-containing protein [Robiginitalea biformata]|uniref:N-succinylornithine carbamoyltransferase n=1 Tax=Robiginitalea biformata (strain ATCC BAA-864 / DSM 15991 / KCTC 12146 / HTCC2501) TaxID=313596 RepID=A4CJ57_ROBBH|nr:acetylornithine carbamoyltransferase [Robiginitalea biformata]EAR16965.1 ornithine carbamoyltransferase [Robiginitalea biformata HTCC2501]